MSEARQVNFFKRLNYPENPISRGFLGKLVRRVAHRLPNDTEVWRVARIRDAV